MAGLCFAYYCSGHGFGHATRVSAFASHLLSLTPPPTIHIVSSAPKHVFNDSIAMGALYRFASIDPVIVQPLAYRVDRQKSVDALKAFLAKKDAKLEEERTWLAEISADCVLSDAAFLGCLAANAAGLPSILITNFTFDSVYSYLSAPLADDTTSILSTTTDSAQLQPPTPHVLADLVPDIPVPQSVLAPLVAQIHAGYRCADLLMLLPGSIPIPSFSVSPALPSPDWIDWREAGFRKDVVTHLTKLCSGERSMDGNLHPAIPFTLSQRPKPTSRKIMHAPLLVRSPTGSITSCCSGSSASVSPSESPFTPSGRSALLSSIGIPSHLHNPERTKILVVSFGGQVFRRVGSRTGSRSGGRGSPMLYGTRKGSVPLNIDNPGLNRSHYTTRNSPTKLDIPSPGSPPSPASSASSFETHTPVRPNISPDEMTSAIQTSPRLATNSHIFIPGAPPASKFSFNSPRDLFETKAVLQPQPEIPGEDGAGLHATKLDLNSTISSLNSYVEFIPNEDAEAADEARGLLPDDTWIAIVCGVTKEQWNTVDGDIDEELPDGFYVAPKDVYMPDLTAVADVLLGKLGYGTVAECVDSATPFVYVSRPLFIEEHGLRLLLSRSGVGVELSRAAYEEGEWAGAIENAWIMGREKKRARNAVGTAHGEKRKQEGGKMVQEVLDWLKDWKDMDGTRDGIRQNVLADRTSIDYNLYLSTYVQE